MLNYRTDAQIIASAAAAAQAECPDLTDLSAGSPFLALLQAGAINALYLQYLVAQVHKSVRLSTSEGDDVDSFIGDFNFTRLPGIRATGEITVSRYLTGQPVIISEGALVKTADGRTYEVVKNTDNDWWSVEDDAYLLPIGEDTATLPIRATGVGKSFNVRAGAITVIASADAIDNVTNEAPIISGDDAETDAEVRSRFIQMLNTRSQATIGAIDYAIQSTQQGLSWKVIQNRDAAGGEQAGYFTVYLDDGSGQISDTLLATIRSNIDAVRPISVTFACLRATALTTNVSVNIEAKPGYRKADLVHLVADAIQAFINGLGVGEPLSFYRLAHIAQDAVDGVESISGLYLNGGTSDIGGQDHLVVRVGTVAVQ